MPEARIGDRTIEVRPFKAYKATLALEYLGEIGNAFPGIVQELALFDREYAKANAIEIPRATFEWRYPDDAKRVSEEAWQQSGGRVIMPAEPSGWEQFMHMFPKVYGEARQHVIDLITVVVIPDSDFEKWDAEGGEEQVDVEVQARRKTLLHEAELDQLVDLLAVTWEVLQKQFEGKAEAIRTGLRSVAGSLGVEIKEDGTVAKSETEEQTDDPDRESPASEEPTSESDSSTGSPPPMAGAETESSTAFPIVSSSPSTG